MPYIIDGNNLIGSSPELSLQDQDARQKIVKLVKKFQESKNTRIIIVFDGEPQAELLRENIHAKFTILFPHFGNTADDEIKRILQKYSHPKDVSVVTSDRALKVFIKELGAKTINSIEFYYEIKKTYRIQGKKEENLKRVNTRLSNTEVEQWLKIFNNK